MHHLDERHGRPSRPNGIRRVSQLSPPSFAHSSPKKQLKILHTFSPRQYSRSSMKPAPRCPRIGPIQTCSACNCYEESSMLEFCLPTVFLQHNRVNSGPGLAITVTELFSYALLIWTNHGQLHSLVCVHALWMSRENLMVSNTT